MINLFTDFEYDLNDALDSVMPRPNREKLPVSGLSYVADFINPEEERALLAAVDPGPWTGIWQRRTQHFGQSYHGYNEEGAKGPTPMPEWVQPLACRLVQYGLFLAPANQVGVNEYQPGQGIAPHVDRNEGDIASLSLGSGCVMDLVSLYGKPSISFFLAPRSVIVITGEARTEWKHGIARRQKDVIDGRAYRRRRRVAIVFRHIVRQLPVEPER